MTANDHLQNNRKVSKMFWFFCRVLAVLVWFLVWWVEVNFLVWRSKRRWPFRSWASWSGSPSLWPSSSFSSFTRRNSGLASSTGSSPGTGSSRRTRRIRPHLWELINWIKTEKQKNLNETFLCGEKYRHLYNGKFTKYLLPIKWKKLPKIFFKATEIFLKVKKLPTIYF